jgi:hypothetical protein
VDLDGKSTNRTYGFTNEINVYFRGVFFQFGEDFGVIVRLSETVHDFELGELYIDRVVVFAKEDFDFVLENGGTTLDDEEDVSESDILDFRAR